MKMGRVVALAAVALPPLLVAGEAWAGGGGAWGEITTQAEGFSSAVYGGLLAMAIIGIAIVGFSMWRGIEGGLPMTGMTLIIAVFLIVGAQAILDGFTGGAAAGGLTTEIHASIGSGDVR